MLDLEEVSLQCTLEEINKMIKFLMEARKQHTKILRKIDICHSHLKNGDDGWRNGDPDLIVVKKIHGLRILYIEREILSEWFISVLKIKGIIQIPVVIRKAER